MNTATRTAKVTFVELSVYENTVPLVSGYLQAYAAQDRAVAEACDFSFFARGLSEDPDALLADLLASDSDVYAFSCYIWNAGLVRRLLAGLLEHRPDAWFILGGAQVINHGEQYIPAGARRVVVCNGEGEQPFYEFLRQILLPEPDLAEVSGVSYRAPDGELVTNDKPPRMKTLDDVPSPFTTGLFDGGEYTFTVLETNRGCPFHCGFCFWGAATNSKVNKFEEERVLGDIRWIAEHGVSSVFIADANWGLSPRDVELSRHIVRCKEEFGFPTSLVIAAAKNRPERVAEITEILVGGGLVTSQPISLQTVNSEALELIDRKNIRESTYTDLQAKLNAKGISSFIELIWPLPGETLETFREGVARLCRLEADTLTVYPQLLLHNTALYDQREILGIETERAPDPVAEADVVVATKWVTREECAAGTWFYYLVQSLYNARGAYWLARHLDRSGTQSYEDFFSAATEHWQRSENGLSRFVAESVSTDDHYDLLNIGKAAHLVLHSHREEFDRLLVDFARSQPWWSDPKARLALDLDLVARPYIYREAVRAPGVPLSEARVVEVTDTSLTIALPEAGRELPAELGLLPAGAGPAEGLHFEHPAYGKMPVPRRRTMEQNAGYCHVMIQRLRTLLPVCRVTGEGGDGGAA
ncbi:B12-binding domain-containing radical SAM protein [Streptomyces sp. NRRL F-5727]|uniref:B12-binding domain-containing radical SAM protein n=1 Tax=Streptomyces sp. NRRL F-5727 TaxID=1463871 RepID=UPI0004C70118|nr:radical SAM protein [Streptomyces sp. NRRL F-5727]